MIPQWFKNVFVLAVAICGCGFFSFPASAQQSAPRIRSRITIYDLSDKSTHVIYTADVLFESANWSPDGKYLMANSGGRIFRFTLNGNATANAEPIGLDPKYFCNNDHGISPDGKMLAFSASSPESRPSQVYVSTVEGKNPKLIVAKTPSYFHSWSPDNKWLAVVAERNGNFDIYRVLATGGEEQRLTTSPGYDDGPDYSPDGKWIYINSDRSGTWDIWRFPGTGAGEKDSKAQRITSDELEDWFPHVSPDGRWIVFLSFPKGTEGHNGRMNVQLRMVPGPDAQQKAAPQVVSSFFGGQGSINVNSWSPDSRKFAYISYEMLPDEAAK